MLPLERYKIAVSEYRAEVSLGAERQKLFIGLNPVIAALAASAGTHNPVTATAALVLAAAASLVGVVVVGRSHERYRHTRRVLLERANDLGCEADWQTTGGMREVRGGPRGEGLRVVTAIKALLAAYAVFDMIAILALWCMR